MFSYLGKYEIICETDFSKIVLLFLNENRNSIK